MIQKIIKIGDALLNNVCSTVDVNDKTFGGIIDDLDDTLRTKPHGVGLAAVQIAIPKQIFLVNYDGFTEFFINPKMIKLSEDLCKINEGCLSIPGVHRDVIRPKSLIIEYLDRNLNSHTKSFDGFVARIIQHEYDHGYGILFLDRINNKSLTYGE